MGAADTLRVQPDVVPARPADEIVVLFVVPPDDDFQAGDGNEPPGEFFLRSRLMRHTRPPRIPGRHLAERANGFERVEPLPLRPDFRDAAFEGREPFPRETGGRAEFPGAGVKACGIPGTVERRIEFDGDFAAARIGQRHRRHPPRHEMKRRKQGIGTLFEPFGLRFAAPVVLDLSHRRPYGPLFPRESGDDRLPETLSFERNFPLTGVDSHRLVHVLKMAAVSARSRHRQRKHVAGNILPRVHDHRSPLTPGRNHPREGGGGIHEPYLLLRGEGRGRDVRGDFRERHDFRGKQPAPAGNRGQRGEQELLPPAFERRYERLNGRGREIRHIAGRGGNIGHARPDDAVSALPSRDGTRGAENRSPGIQHEEIRVPPGEFENDTVTGIHGEGEHPVSGSHGYPGETLPRETGEMPVLRIPARDEPFFHQVEVWHVGNAGEFEGVIPLETEEKIPVPAKPDDFDLPPGEFAVEDGALGDDGEVIHGCLSIGMTSFNTGGVLISIPPRGKVSRFPAGDKPIVHIPLFLLIHGRANSNMGEEHRTAFPSAHFTGRHLMHRRSFLGNAALATGIGCAGIAHAAPPAARTTGTDGKLASLSLKALRNQYRAEFDEFVTFFDRYVVDTQYGGFMCSTDHDGSHLNETKTASTEGRGIWCYSFMYNRGLVKDPRFLNYAKRSIDFILPHKPSGSDYWPGTYSRTGEVISPNGNLASDCYIAEGLAEYGRAAGEGKYGDIAREIVFKCLANYDTPDFQDGQNPYPGARNLWYWMMFMWFGTHWLTNRPDPEMEKLVDRCIDAILNAHMHPDYQLMNYAVNHDHSRASGENDKYARAGSCGHATEAAWMIMYEAVRRKDRALFDRASETFRRHAEVSRDDVYGGVFNDLEDIEANKWQLTKIFWAQAFILIGSLAVIEHTGADWAKNMFSEQFAYIETMCRLRRWGYPLMIDSGDRRISELPKARRKDIYHHPRYLMLNLLALERMGRRRGKVSGVFA